MTEFLLYGTEGCHLCEEAEALLHEARIAFEYRDILDREQWQEKFGILIPVLWHAVSQRQLNWPFDSLQILKFKDLCKAAGHNQDS